MANVNTLNILNNFFERMKFSPGSMEVNSLKRMCIVPLLKDIISGTMSNLSCGHKQFWQKFIAKCYPDMNMVYTTSKSSGGSSGGGGGTTPITPDTPDTPTPSTTNRVVYVGSARNLPSGNNIPSYSTAYDLSKPGVVPTVMTSGTFLWIAVPSGMSVSRVDNMEFAGDYIPMSRFRKNIVTIHNAPHTLYYIESAIPMMTNYKITII